MKRVSAPPSSINVAIVCRNMWHDPCLLICAAFTYMLTPSLKKSIAFKKGVRIKKNGENRHIVQRKDNR